MPTGCQASFPNRVSLTALLFISPGFFSPGVSRLARSMVLRLGLFRSRVLMTSVFMSGIPVSVLPVVLMELVGNVILRFHQVLLEFLFGVPAPPCRVPQLPGRLRTTGIQVGGALPSCLLCRRHPRSCIFPGVPAGILAALAVLRPVRPRLFVHLDSSLVAA